ESPHFLLACQKLNNHVLMLRRDALSGNERMPAAHQTTQSVHFGAGALIPLQDVEKRKSGAIDLAARVRRTSLWASTSSLFTPWRRTRTCNCESRRNANCRGWRRSSASPK